MRQDYLKIVPIIFTVFRLAAAQCLSNISANIKIGSQGEPESLVNNERWVYGDGITLRCGDTAEEGKWVYWLIWISGAWEPVRFDDVVTPIGLTSIHFSAAPSAGRSEDVSSRHSTCYMCVAWSSAMELSFSDVVVVRYPSFSRYETEVHNYSSPGHCCHQCWDSEGYRVPPELLKNSIHWESNRQIQHGITFCHNSSVLKSEEKTRTWTCYLNPNSTLFTSRDILRILRYVNETKQPGLKDNCKNEPYPSLATLPAQNHKYKECILTITTDRLSIGGGDLGHSKNSDTRWFYFENGEGVYSSGKSLKIDNPGNDSVATDIFACIGVTCYIAHVKVVKGTARILTVVLITLSVLICLALVGVLVTKCLLRTSKKKSSVNPLRKGRDSKTSNRSKRSYNSGKRTKNTKNTPNDKSAKGSKSRAGPGVGGVIYTMSGDVHNNSYGSKMKRRSSKNTESRPLPMPLPKTPEAVTGIYTVPYEMPYQSA